MDHNCLLCGNRIEDSYSLLEIIFLMKEELITCQPCQKKFKRVDQKHCPACFKSGSAKLCHDCIEWNKKGYEVNHSAMFKYNDYMKAYFSTYKFQGDYLLRKVFAKSLLKAVRKDYKEYVLVPIPVSPERTEIRGFNQITAILEVAGCQFLPMISKVENEHQSHRNKVQRLESANSFYANELTKKVQKNQKLLIIDDIYTTGTTIKHVRDVLIAEGFTNIKSFSIAR
ncbi:ComF family protein [Streptococcus pseudoporcinus]|uniref:Late competence protein n=1 Tax=Streptococcus pseudoporcinus TaxID=361101 RepID=A0A4U9Y342_9STRE|nr:ComF family protein [Streptococcus pseudoporcinus]VTS19995.1 late competence protein [Streptococcus pseudoporcinus]VUC69061.1 late competence protein [Streptococcus pseudoporcinus]VUC99637.1 late competence protein [Streptococcus pseudoporcinus]VUD00030.1 late competence protein [Streptococcus pseudoporcinus]